MKSIPEMSSEEVIRELCERLGLCWHEPGKRGRFTRICQKCGKIGNLRYYNLRYRNFYSDPGKVQLLREMKIKKLLDRFLAGLPPEIGIFTFTYVFVIGEGKEDGLLAITALDWLRRFDGNN